jgi:hypothetical protein
METIALLEDEVVLYNGEATSNEYKGNLKITLTSHQIVVEKEKGLFKKEIELLDTIALEDIKTYNHVVQIKQKGASAEIQTKTKNITFNFSGLIEARKFVGKAIDASTGTTLAKRSSDKVKSALDLTDDTLGLDTRGTIKSVLEQGIKGTLINGIKKKK